MILNAGQKDLRKKNLILSGVLRVGFVTNTESDLDMGKPRFVPANAITGTEADIVVCGSLEMTLGAITGTELGMNLFASFEPSSIEEIIKRRSLLKTIVSEKTPLAQSLEFSSDICTIKIEKSELRTVIKSKPNIKTIINEKSKLYG